ncbi:hypothetical protein A2U01_0021997, partial [Trifolium medium]|nr:hypothetical protein [Trifolium medium]
PNSEVYNPTNEDRYAVNVVDISRIPSYLKNQQTPITAIRHHHAYLQPPPVTGHHRHVCHQSPPVTGHHPPPDAAIHDG